MDSFKIPLYRLTSSAFKSTKLSRYIKLKGTFPPESVSTVIPDNFCSVYLRHDSANDPVLVLKKQIFQAPMISDVVQIERVAHDQRVLVVQRAPQLVSQSPESPPLDESRVHVVEGENHPVRAAGSLSERKKKFGR